MLPILSWMPFFWEVWDDVGRTLCYRSFAAQRSPPLGLFQAWVNLRGAGLAWGDLQLAAVSLGQR